MGSLEVKGQNKRLVGTVRYQAGDQNSSKASATRWTTYAFFGPKLHLSIRNFSSGRSELFHFSPVALFCTVLPRESKRPFRPTSLRKEDEPDREIPRRCVSTELGQRSDTEGGQGPQRTCVDLYALPRRQRNDLWVGSMCQRKPPKGSILIKHLKANPVAAFYMMEQTVKKVSGVRQLEQFSSFTRCASRVNQSHLPSNRGGAYPAIAD